MEQWANLVDPNEMKEDRASSMSHIQEDDDGDGGKMVDI